MIPWINIVLLQTTPAQGFLQWLNPMSQSNPSFAILPSYTNIMVVAVILGLLFLGGRIYYNYKKFPISETRVDVYHFHVQDYFDFMASISRDEEPLMESTLQELETIPEIADGIKHMREWAGKKQIFIYQGIYKDTEHAIDLRGDGSKFTMITTVDIDNPDYYTIDKKGRWDWGTLRKEHHRQMICLIPSVRRDGSTIDGNEKDVWFVYPMFKPKIGGTKIFESDIKQLVTRTISMTMNIIDPQQTIKIASIFDWLVPLKRMQQTLNDIDRNDRLGQGMVRKAYRLVTEERVSADMARGIAARNPVYKIMMEPKKTFGEEPILWLVLTAVAGFIGAKLPSMVGALSSQDPALLAILASFIVVGLYLILSSKKKDKEKEDMQKIEESDNQQKVER
jgi:hypothetical protein